LSSSFDEENTGQERRVIHLQGGEKVYQAASDQFDNRAITFEDCKRLKSHLLGIQPLAKCDCPEFGNCWKDVY
jgi:hypothetical protein